MTNTTNSLVDNLKISESTLLTILFDYKKELWKSHLSQNEKFEIEYRFNLLEKITHETFKNKYENIRKPITTVGNI